MQLGWVDFSREDREKVLAVISLLQEQGAVDELGIGLVRDAFANYFFPGTSTIQTRAKYFLIVPYILQEAVLGKYGNSVREILERINREEKKCGQILYDHCKGNPNGAGIIGARVLPKGWVARKPSSIYWNGIRTFGIYTQDSLSIPEMVGISVRLRMQSKESALGNRIDNADEGEKDDLDTARAETIRFFDLPC